MGGRGEVMLEFLERGEVKITTFEASVISFTMSPLCLRVCIVFIERKNKLYIGCDQLWHLKITKSLQSLQLPVCKLLKNKLA